MNRAIDAVDLRSIPIRNIFGVPIHACTMGQTLTVCKKAIDSHQKLVISVVNAAKIVKTRREPSLRDAVVGSDLVLTDGMSVVWASRLLGRPVPERIAGIDLFEQLLAMADRHSYSVFLLGATQAVLDLVVESVRSNHPNSRIVGSRDGYFTEEESESVAKAINSARPDMLFVAISSPRKETFLANWAPVMNSAVCHGVGGSFDVMAGKRKRAPVFLQKIGLEWFYRVLQEPSRLWKRYLVTNTVFIGLVFCGTVRRVLRFGRP